MELYMEISNNEQRTSSKATLRVNLEDITPAVPRLILEQLASSRFAADRGKALVFQADTSRKQGDNKDDCFSKLDDLIASCYSNAVKKDASPEQLKKVEKLQVKFRYYGYHEV